MTAGMDAVRAAVAGTAQWHEDSGVFVRLAALRAALAEHEYLRALLREAAPWLRPSEDSPPELDVLHARIDAALAGEKP